MFDFINPCCSIPNVEFLDSVGAERRKQILNSGCIRPKHKRISKETKAVCEEIQKEYKAWSKTNSKSLNVPPKWLKDFENKMHEKQRKSTANGKKPDNTKNGSIVVKESKEKKPKKDCKKKDKVVNPITGICITIGKATYKKLVKEGLID